MDTAGARAALAQLQREEKEARAAAGARQLAESAKARTQQAGYRLAEHLGELHKASDSSRGNVT